MTAQEVTLLAAIIAAVAAGFAAIVSSVTARRVAKEAARAQELRESTVFRRDRVAELKQILFDGVIALDTLRENCNSVPWIAKTPIEKIHERGAREISRISLAFDTLDKMNALPPDGYTPYMLGYYFRGFVGKVVTYQEQIAAGNIELSGHASPAGKEAENNLAEADEEWRAKLKDLRDAVAAVYSAA
jgi:hypothetical protein